MTTISELSAVNTMLAAIGVAPVNTISTGGVEISIAHKTLTDVNREIQAYGWTFNREREYKLVRDFPTNEINVTADILRVDTSGNTADRDAVQRGLRLYDRENNTYEWDTDLYVDQVRLLDFADLPDTAKTYITLKSARRFIANVVGSGDLVGFTVEDERQALVLLKNGEAKTGKHNMANNYSVFNILDRTPRGGRLRWR